MRVVIRADASHCIGHGHVMRCLTLAAALRVRGAAVLFVCREHPGHLCDLIATRGFPVRRLSVNPAAAGAPAAWLGASAEEDAAATGQATSEFGEVAWIIADHYAIDSAWERAVAPVAKRVMVIDDLADRVHDCDILLDQNYVTKLERRYDGLLPRRCARLLGPRYALLQPEYRRHHEEFAPRGAPPRRLLIAFGGADRHNLTARSLAAVISLGRDDLQIDAVVSDGSPHRAAIDALVAGRDDVRVHFALPSLAPLIAAADLGIGAAGATTWERLCLGLPSLVVTLAENQRPIAEALHADGFIVWLGDETTVDSACIAAAVASRLDAGADPEWSLRCLRLVDGRGADRVAAAIMIGGGTVLRARPARAEDEDLLLEWANDPVTRANSFSPERIPAASHHTWFATRLHADASSRIVVMESADGVPVGQVRFDRAPKGWVIDYSVAPGLRGRGLGRTLLQTALSSLREGEPDLTIVGIVKRENVASSRVFEGLGFRRTERADGIVWSIRFDELRVGGSLFADRGDRE